MKKISQGNKGIQALAKKNPSLVEDKFGYDVPGYMYGGMPMSYMGGGDVRYMAEGGFNFSSLNNMNPKTPTMTPGSVINSSPINIPDNFQGDARGIEAILSGNMIGSDQNNVMDPNFKFEPDLSVEYDEENPYDLNKSDYDNYMNATRTVEDDARDDLKLAVQNAKDEASLEKKERILEGIASLGEIESMSGMDSSPTMSEGYSIGGTGATPVKIQRFRMGGITSIQPKFNFENDFDINDYMENVLGIGGRGRGGKGGRGIGDFPELDELTEEEMAERQARAAAARIALGYGSQGGAGVIGRSSYSDTTPGASISIDARDETPDAYRFYPSEVSKLYSQMKGVPFSPLVAPPKEATYIDSLKPRRIQSQLYAADGKFVDRSELITGPGGERGDKIPAMLSDGEFVVNAKAVRGMGVAAGANPQDEYEQRLEGARQMYALQKEGEQMMRKYR